MHYDTPIVHFYFRKYIAMLDGVFEQGYKLLCNLYASAKVRQEMEEEKLKQAAAIEALSEQADKDRKLYEENLEKLNKKFAEDSKKREEELASLRRQLDNIRVGGGSRGLCVIL